jgi:hypothetical protein
MCDSEIYLLLIVYFYAQSEVNNESTWKNTFIQMTRLPFEHLSTTIHFFHHIVTF